ncbi:MAG: PAS domain S-box protein [Sulfurovum sp.]|nr:PAS domain S-box protein [Sulfurovum sp.]
MKLYDGKPMISETDTQGIITYANKYFLEFNGFTKEELIGLPHSVLRHPDMPKGVFRAMWKIITQKKVWRGYLKNLCKDGSYYWALVYIQPKLDESGKIIGYVANRRDAYPHAIIEVSEKYEALQGDAHKDDPYFMRAELYHGSDMATFEAKL